MHQYHDRLQQRRERRRLAEWRQGRAWCVQTAIAARNRRAGLPGTSSRVLDENCGLSDEEALERAVRESLILTKPSPPDELCCPITLEPFRDPVSTIRGQTYERSAIVDWLNKSATDPITGCPLKITTVWADKEMLKRVGAFYAS